MRWALAILVFRAALAADYDREIRPILSDKCYACHGPDAANRKANLRLDVESEARPKFGEVLKRITSTSPVKRMPPAYAGRDKLSDKEIGAIEQWVRQGAPWQSHWSFVPPTRDRSATVDALIRRHLAQAGLKPAPEADRHTLIRRVTLDLTGLPPTPEEVDAFVRDGDYERVVDRLLASPRYAERMAIRWLEAARYADTNGYQSDGPRDMWRWRDWVIDAFDRNMPFDRFTIEQIAGDLLPNRTLSQQIATAFNRNHRTSAEGGIVDEEFRSEYVSDRTETTSTVWLGLTTGCARCHDHKYDPIKQRDYYSFYAFFNNVPEKGFVYDFGNERPYVKAPLPDQAARLADLDRRIDALRARAREHEKGARATGDDFYIKDGLVFRYAAARSFDGKQSFEAPGKDTARFNYRDPFTFSAWVTPRTLNGAILSRAEDYFEGSGHALYLLDGKLRLHVIFRWTDLGMRVESAEPLKPGERRHVLVTYDGSMQAAGVRMYVDGAPVAMKILFDQCIWPIDVRQPLRLGAGGGMNFNGTLEDVRVYNRALSSEEASTVPLVGPVLPNPESDAARVRMRLAWLERNPPLDSAELARLEAERKKLDDSIPTVMVMEERPIVRPTFVLKRGAYDAPGEPVSPAVPSFLPPLPGGAPRNRLGLARWLVDRGNPLTARVAVNRYWQMLFGTGLVKTVEDFGSQGESPAYRDVLDWLAVEFMDSGWDVKHTLKTIVMSAAYRQSSKVSPELLARDPENRLLARGPRIRLAPEMVRDQALAVSGLLVDKVGGPSVKPYQPAGLWQELSSGGRGYVEDKGEGLYRRSLYSYWKRTVAPPSMVNFDSPNRETCVVRETRTNTPLQALDLMNNVTYVEAARKLAERMIAAGPGAAARINRGYRLMLGREARAAERDVLARALAKFDAAYQKDPNSAAALLKVGASPAAGEPVELAAWTGIASLLLNLDEAVTKP